MQQQQHITTSPLTHPGIPRDFEPSVNGQATSHAKRRGRKSDRVHSPPADESLPTTLSHLHDSVTSAAIQRAISATLPTSPRYRLRSIFDFIRRLKAEAELANADPVSLKPLAKAWHEAAGLTDDFQTTTWRDFLARWDAPKCFAGEDAVDEALKFVDAGDLPQEADGCGPAMSRLIAVCWRLAGNTGRFFISARDAARVLLKPTRRHDAKSVDAMSGWRALRRLEASGIIQVVKRGTRPPDSKATRYRWGGNHV